ncbi:MAG: DUF2335 domain-containing protein [Candidatus Aminicenantes bacterium]|nr:MAG: DUF2335 domain-containing protein [Candidatus Aminicenantes bacterium]
MSEPNNKPGKLIEPNSELAGSNNEESEKIEKVAALILRKYQGPLPPPETLKEYNEILPDAAERIFSMAEKEQQHHHNTEKKLVDHEIKKTNKGQNFAFFTALIGIVGAVVCAFLGQVVIGSVVGGSTLVSLVSSFLSSKQEKKKGENNDNHEDERN